ncbi:MAG: di-trans,poly-cis-decaprenylcistransferase, partial [Thermoleophilia bacterium]|nr:di-trans,poly-cis-decaprenylcistransferase [Thermoleophilia bacterium]
LHQNNCRVAFVGSRDNLSKPLLEKMEWAEDLTAGNTRMVLFIAFNYGGRQEIAHAVRRAVAAGVDPAEITEEDISQHLYSLIMRDPDLCIRTSGERRISNFLLWQSAYSEFLFLDCLWPDFGKEEFERALADYAGRERRFGTRRGRADA